MGPHLIRTNFRQCSILRVFRLCAALLVLSGISLFFNPLGSWAEPVPLTTAASAEDLRSLGMEAFRRGAFEEAVERWNKAIVLFEKEGKTSSQIEVLILCSQAYQSIGLYKEALTRLESAQTLAEKSGSRKSVAAVFGSLGNLYIATGPEDKALQYLRKGLAVARELGDAGLIAQILNNVGNLLTAQKKFSEAIEAYQESITFAKKSNSASTIATAATNGALTLIQMGRYHDSKALIDMALEYTQRLDDSHEKAYGLTNIGIAYFELSAHLHEYKDVLLRTSSQLFNQAAVIAEGLGDLRAQSYAWGYLGKLFESEQDYAAAFQATHRAVFAAQQVQAPESLYLWQWQTGRLLAAQRKIDDAISAYRNTIHTLQSIRYELSQCYGAPQLSFRESVGPVYFEFVDLLLQRAASMKTSAEYGPYLEEARETVELLKVAELRDYFQDECLGAARLRLTRLDVVSKTAVVIYPIILKDRIELLASLPTGLKRTSVKVDEGTLSEEVRRFRSTLEKRTTREYLPHAQRLYDWLMRPLEPDLKGIGVDTLVFVPDGPLRTIPMAALHDGKEFLVNRYATAVTPGLDLTDPRTLKRDGIRVLSAGLTDATQGFPPLPDVAAELETIHSLYRGDQLINKDFLTSTIKNELKDKQFSIVHIASHGQFEGDVRRTFLLTFDDKLTIDQLDQYVGLFRFRDEPLELLTLSACETAVGDDRAALGLAGVAVKAGARSALATLWHINDQASSLLIDEFYRQLKDPSVSRTAALRHAQLKLLTHTWYQHPGYWSPFLLINNWL